MPYRPLVYPRRDGAQQHPHGQQPEQFFAPSTQPLMPYHWSEMDFHTYSDLNGNAPMTNSEQAYPRKHPAQTLDIAQSHDGSFFHRNGFGLPPNHPFGLDHEGFCHAHSFPYTDLMEADVSSISQGSLYSPITTNSHLDGTLDEDRLSVPSSSSRKLSSASDPDLSNSVDGLCPIHPGNPQECEARRCASNPQFRSLATISECTSMHGLTYPAAGQPQLSPTTSPEQSINSPQKSKERRARSSTIKENREATTSHAQRKTNTRASQRPTPRSSPTHSSDNGSITMDQSNKVRARQAHSLIERKYRENLNAKIQALHQTLQQTQFGPKNSHVRASSEDTNDNEDDEEDTKDKAPKGSRPKKSDVLIEAMSYVNATEVEMRHMTDEIRRLTARVQMLEQLVKCEDCNLMKHMVTMELRKPI